MVLFGVKQQHGLCVYQDLLYRRARALADYENSNKALEKARMRSKDVAQAEEHQQQCLKKFDKLSESGKKGQLESGCGTGLLYSICAVAFQVKS